MIIRSATMQDIEKIARLYIRNHTQTYKGILSDEYFAGLTLNFAKKKWGNYLNAQGRIILTVYDEDEFLGFTAGMEDEKL